MINIENVSKIYKNGENSFSAVDNVSLKVDKGEFLLIMGKSGCGKSTLLNIIGCMDKATSGSYFLNGKDVLNLKEKELSKIRNNYIGFVFQSFNLIDELNCIDNIELIQGYAGTKKPERKKRSNFLLDMVGLQTKAKSYPSQLSGGEQQRIAIARAISNYPDLIIADEPTGNLDVNNGIKIMEILKELNKNGVTVIMVSHDIEMSKYSSKTIYMQDGKFIDIPAVLK